MKKLTIIFLLLILSNVCLMAQLKKMPSKEKTQPKPVYLIYRLYLKDKQGTQYTLSRPEEFLSAKSILRREKQNLPLDSTDLPLSSRYTAAIEQAGLKIIGHSKWNNTVLVKVKSPAEIAVADNISCVTGKKQVFSTQDHVSYKIMFDPDQFYSIRANFINFWTLDSIHKRGRQQIEMLNGLKLHQAGFKGKGMWIAILDGGYKNLNTLSKMRNISILGLKDFVYPYNANLYQKASHGTMVLSTMASNNPRSFTGTAPEASYLLLRSEDTDSESEVEEDYWAQAAEYADSVGVDIINSSLGYTTFDNKKNSHTYRELNGETALISRTASLLASKGIILTNSAGNSGNDSWKLIGFPADAKNILAVGSIKTDSLNSSFSSLGPSFDGRVKPDVMALGYDALVINIHNDVDQSSGTSFSSPMLCGLVACLWQALPNKTCYEIMDLIRKSSDRYHYHDNVFGYGIPNFWKAYQNGMNQP